MDTDARNHEVRILLVDDQALDRTTLRGVLAQEIPGAEVVEVGNAAALVQALEDRVDAVILDTAQAWTDAPELAVSIHRRYPGAPILAFSEQPLDPVARPELAVVLRGQIQKSREGFVQVARQLRRLLEHAGVLAPPTHPQPPDVMAQLPYPALVLGRYGNVLRWNEAARALLAPESPPTEQPAIDALLPPPPGPAGWREYLETLEGPERFTTYARVNNEVLEVEVWPVESADQRDRRVFGMRLDTERRQEAPEETPGVSDEMAEELMQVISHDLREPLHALRHYLSKLSGGDTVAHETLSRLINQSSRLEAMLEDLSGYVRSSAEPATDATADLEQVLRDVLSDLTPAIEETGARITHDALPKVQASPEQMRVLFRNLISNAIKYHADEPPRVQVTVSEQKNTWIFGIKDNGIGIPEDQKDQVFEPFRRGKGAEGRSGQGMGLAICARIVRRHGGKIWVRTAPEKGTSVFFTLPKRDKKQ